MGGQSLTTKSNDAFGITNRSLVERIQRIPGVSVDMVDRYGIGVTTNRPWISVQLPIIRSLISYAHDDVIITEWSGEKSYGNTLLLKSEKRLSDQIAEESEGTPVDQAHFDPQMPKWNQEALGPLGTAVATRLHGVEGVESIVISPNEVRIIISPAFSRAETEGSCKAAVVTALAETKPETTPMRKQRLARIIRLRRPVNTGVSIYPNVVVQY